MTTGRLGRPVSFGASVRNTRGDLAVCRE